MPKNGDKLIDRTKVVMEGSTLLKDQEWILFWIVVISNKKNYLAKDVHITLIEIYLKSIIR